MSTWAIGDLQGCFDPLETLLERCGFDRRRDRLWFVGDLVNRGPKSLETLRFVCDLGDAAVTVLGNHDLSLLMIAAGHGKQHRLDTFHHVLDAPDRDELLAWLRERPMMHVEGGFAMVHAGLLPQWDVAQAMLLAREVEDALRGPQHAEFMLRMWGSEPAAWSDTLTAGTACASSSMRLHVCASARRPVTWSSSARGRRTSLRPDTCRGSTLRPRAGARTPWCAVTGRRWAIVALPI